MRDFWNRFTAIGLLLAATGCAQAPPATQPPPAAAIPAAPSPVSTPMSIGTAPTQSAVNAEAARLRIVLAQTISRHKPQARPADRDWITLAKAAIASAFYPIDRPQLLVVVDRNPAVQQLRVILAQPAGQPWQVIGGSQVSTGQAGRRGYFITPTGVFSHTDGILDYRALGTFNENHIRGLGLKGMRVWDFGWQTASKGWRTDREPGEIRLLLHATDPDYLEQRLGRPASEGCVRIPAEMNRFLDQHGVLDADYEQAAVADPRFGALLLPGRQPTILAGRVMIVVDSSESI